MEGGGLDIARLIDRFTGSGEFDLAWVGKGMHACIGVNLAAGVVPKKDSDPATHQYGIITLIAKKLLEYGVTPDKNNPGVVDTSTARNNWSSYPILFRS